MTGFVLRTFQHRRLASGKDAILFHWTPARDAALMEGMAEGLSFREAGHRVGASRASAEQRFRRLASAFGWQAA